VTAAVPSPSPAFRGLVLGLATVGGLGLLPYRLVKFKKWKGGGILGTLAGWGLLWAVPAEGWVFWFWFAALLALSVAVSHRAEAWLTPDDPRIVIDEVIGVWVACAGLPRTLAPMAAGMVLFRVFDVFKGPWGRAAERLPGGWGIVADDLVAGVIAQVLVRAGLAWIS